MDPVSGAARHATLVAGTHHSVAGEARTCLRPRCGDGGAYGHDSGKDAGEHADCDLDLRVRGYLLFIRQFRRDWLSG